MEGIAPATLAPTLNAPTAWAHLPPNPRVKDRGGLR